MHAQKSAKALLCGTSGAADQSKRYARASAAVMSDQAVAVRRKRRANGLRLYHETWKAAKDLFVDIGRLENWERWEHRFDSKIRSVENARQLANEMLKSLRDHYTELSVNTPEQKNKEHVTSTRMLPGDIGYLRLEDFNERTTALQMRRALRKLRSCNSIVLDLRGNVGGYTDQAVDCVSLFISRGKVATFDYRVWRSDNRRLVDVSLTPDRFVKRISNGETVRTVTSKRRYRCVVRKKTRLVVLVDRSTASSAEILTAALQQNGRATVIGDYTFGKGVGQSFRRMPNNTELSITTFYVYTPNGYWAGDGYRQRNRIEPDKVVVSKGRIYRSSLARDKQLQAALEYLSQPVA